MLLTPLFTVAQNTYVSKPAADLISSGHYYIRFDGKFYDPEEDTDVKLKIATATNNGVSCTINENADAMTLNSAKGTFILDTKNKTYQSVNQNAEQFDIGRLTFYKQGKCKLNGKDFYFDEYKTLGGNHVKFYYNSTKIAALDFGIDGMSVLNLAELDKKIPSNMILCLTPDWKASTTASSAVSSMQQQIIEQMRKEIDPNDLPDGMTVDDVINMALGKMNGVGQKNTATPTAEPPKCQKPYTDSSSSDNLADPTTYTNIKITDVQYVTTPVYASSFSKPKQPEGVNDTSLSVSSAGIAQQLKLLEKEFQNKTDEQIDKYLENASADVFNALQLNIVNGKLIEYALALSIARPDVANINNAGLLLAYAGDTEAAGQMFQKALSFDEQNAVVQVNIAEYFLEKGDLKNARRYAEQAALLQPDFGEAYQIITAINIKEGKMYEAAHTLFKSAETFFNDITAMQFASLIYNVRFEQHKVAENPSYPYMTFVNKIFTKENLESLAKATKAGGVSNGQDVIPNMKEFPWPVKNAQIWELHKSYINKSDKNISAAIERIDERNKAIMDLDRYAICYYETMGMQNLEPDLAATEQFVKQKTGKDVPIKLPDINMYKAISNYIADDNQVVYYPDARQFWCLKVWECYYEIMLQYHEGFWWDSEKGNPVNYPAAYQKLQDKLKAQDDNHELDWKQYSEQIKSIFKAETECLDKAETERQEIRCKITAAQACMNAGETFTRGKSQTYHINQMHALKDYYNQEIKPSLEEWWQKTIAMGAYCDKYAVQEFFENAVLRAANLSWLDRNYRDAWFHGKLIQNDWDNLVEHPRRIRDSLYALLATLPPDPPKPPQQMPAGGSDGLDNGNCQLQNYGEKKKPWIEFGISAGPYGRIGLRMDPNGDISITNEGNIYTGRNVRWNLSNGQTTVTGYPTLADELSGKAKEGFFDRAAKYYKGQAISAATNLPYIGKVISCMDNAQSGAGFQPYVKYLSDSGSYTSVTTDANGNVTGSSRVNFKEIGVTSHEITLKYHRETQRTGTYRRQKEWMSVGLTIFDFRAGN